MPGRLSPTPVGDAGRRVARAALIKWALQALAATMSVAAVLAIVFLPSYVTESESSSGERSVDTATALEVVGPRLLLVLAIPIMITVVPVIFRGRGWQVLSVASAVLLVIFAAVGSASIGWYFIPAILVSIAGAAVPAPKTRRSIGSSET